jgi:1,2-beta-oligoglucan phosphorylase
MSESDVQTASLRLTGFGGMRADLNFHGGIRHLDCGAIALALFVGNEVESGVGNVYLRRVGHPTQFIPLLGPASPTQFQPPTTDNARLGFGEWLGVRYSVGLVLAKSATTWFWHIQLENTTNTPLHLDLTYAQDLALAPYGAVRLNEFYVSQYLDHAPLKHPEHGVVVASRQNQAADGRNPWSLIGSLRSGVSFATDALDFHGLATRAGAAPIGLTHELPNRRLQHEHSLVVIRDLPFELAANARLDCGFFGAYREHHPEASSSADLRRVDEALSLPEAKPALLQGRSALAAPSLATLFSHAPPLRVLALDEAALKSLFSEPWRNCERNGSDGLLSFFHGADCHVVLRAKELKVLRPHGHILRTGRHLTPDESALTSTVWMTGVFHSMVTQGHVSINRMLSTTHSYLSLFRAHGQRVFVEIDGTWQLLDVPSAFEMAPDACLWVYRHARGEIRVRAAAHSGPHELTLAIEVSSGVPTRFLISNHIALNGDDGSTLGPALWRQEGPDILVGAARDSDVGRRFPNGCLRIAPLGATQFEQIAGDEALFLDHQSRQEPFVCLVTAPARNVGLRLRGELVLQAAENPIHVAPDEELIPLLSLHGVPDSAGSESSTRLADIAPWLTHNALVHYLSPRGLEQYSGGGWGTRDVCQGPVEMLLALDRIPPIRDLLLRVTSQQNPDGDWPQWFMFFDRERNIRPGDSHGDIVYWPLLVLGQYLTASGDGGILNQRVPFFDTRGPSAGESGTVSEHVRRALALIAKRVIPGTSLAAYGHGDWNDSLQPADPMLRDRLCSAWTVTLDVQTLTTLAQGLRAVGYPNDAADLESRAAAVRQDFQRLLIADGVLTGYALFDANGQIRRLLHPSDTTTGVRYSALAMVHAILEDLFTPEQTREHLRLIEKHLSGPDGLRLFDQPLAYHGGPQRLFQRAETATYFGREIGLMYMHAHLRYAQALAHVGNAEGFFRALCQANPIAIRELVSSASPRQANCYYSSSDAAFDNRYQASAEYERVARGTIALEGGWRVYSSGAGIALGLIWRRFLGLTIEWNALVVDPVIPARLDGLSVETRLLGRPCRVRYSVRNAGCGVQEIVLNDQALPFDLRSNPHRRGAAVVARAQVGEKLRTQDNELHVVVG